MVKVRCVVVTPETTVLDEEADFVAFPAYDGEVGIYPRRAPLVARLGIGELRLRSGTQTKRYFVDGGFAQVHDDVVSILTPRARKASDINTADAERQLAAANAEVPTTEAAFKDKAARLQRARVQIRLAHT